MMTKEEKLEAVAEAVKLTTAFVKQFFEYEEVAQMELESKDGSFRISVIRTDRKPCGVAE